jgi:hypothetical protein
VIRVPTPPVPGLCFAEAKALLYLEGQPFKYLLMKQELSTDTIVKLTRQVAALYIQEEPNQTLGEWVLAKFYPDVNLADLFNARDFRGAVRTFDGRMYLGGMLRSGSLSPEPLLRAVEEMEISDAALAEVI